MNYRLLRLLRIKRETRRRSRGLTPLAALLCVALVTPGWSQSPPVIKPYKVEPSGAALKWANTELGRMSLDEKIGQLIAVGINATFLNQDSDAFQTLKHQVEDLHIGGIILFRGPVYESVILVNRMQQMARYPLLISADLEAGIG